MTQPGDQRESHSPESARPESARPESVHSRGEVVISGVDTGPRNEERGNLTPTEDHARFQPQLHPASEPADEDA